MKTWYWIFIFYFFTICAWAHNARLIITANKQPAIGASIFVNGIFKTIADERGEVHIAKIQNGDTIRTSYLGYKPEIIIFSLHHETFEINLIQEPLEIKGITLSPANDINLFKQMLKKGLKEMTVDEATPFCLIDTLQFLTDTDIVYRECTGNFIYPTRGYSVITKKKQTKILETTPEACKINYLSKYDNKQENNLFKNYKIPTREIGLCFFDVFCLSKFDKNIRFIYMGKDSVGYEQFYFIIPNNSWIISDYSKNKVYFGGIVYLNADGVIKKIKKHKTSFDVSVESYEYDIDFAYDQISNRVIPYQAYIRTYSFDEDLNIRLMQNAYLEIYSHLAIDAALISN